jgi:hypothetical protein
MVDFRVLFMFTNNDSKYLLSSYGHIIASYNARTLSIFIVGFVLLFSSCEHLAGYCYYRPPNAMHAAAEDAGEST